MSRVGTGAATGRRSEILVEFQQIRTPTLLDKLIAIIG
jgi:hypothetical protein